MNNVRDAPRQPRDFSEGAGKGPLLLGASLQGDAVVAAPLPQKGMLPPPQASELPLPHPEESASSCSHHGDEWSPGICEAKRRHQERGDNSAEPKAAEGTHPRGAVEGRDPTPDQIPQPRREALRSPERAGALLVPFQVSGACWGPHVPTHGWQEGLHVPHV